MSTDISMQSKTFQVGNRTWHRSREGNGYRPNVTLDIAKFSQNEAQKVTIDATSGNFTLTYAGQTTGNIAYNAAATAVQTALAGLSTVGAGNVSVSGSDGGPYTVTFLGALGSQDIALLTANAAGLSGNTHTVTIATITPAHYANGYIPSGTILGKVTATGLYGPYDDSAGDGRNVATGVLWTDVRAIRDDGTTATKVGSSQMVRGDVSVAKLPFQAGSGAIDTNGKADLPLIRWEA
ncbi:bacteriophage lambda head decoration protein D [Mycobacterium sp. BK086]|uniref:head decoration protein n=1 Tax=Mycobacterium sp. BK086 TaxID=2512165 RepID=UPI00105FE20B|nr:head decoration protein [Mycobacterium sp. BK086]TDO18140.1 bacteriophage lambda head decoration protein D [Mycobacterium sp. BK086]